jgi:hypothetical protein
MGSLDGKNFFNKVFSRKFELNRNVAKNKEKFETVDDVVGL